jgi:uncharacterized membrane protein
MVKTLSEILASGQLQRRRILVNMIKNIITLDMTLHHVIHRSTPISILSIIHNSMSSIIGETLIRREIILHRLIGLRIIARFLICPCFHLHLDYYLPSYRSSFIIRLLT